MYKLILLISPLIFHTSHKIISFVIIRMYFFHASHENYLIRIDFSRNYHASHEIISFVVIRMDFFSCFALIRMDFSQNYHALHEIISFVVIIMDFSCFNNLIFE